MRCNGLLCYNNRIVIPPGSPLITALLKEHHDSFIGGHSGALRTFKRLSQQFFWPSMHKTVREYVAACDTCHRAKYESLSPAGLLQPLPIPNQIWEDLSMDFVDGLPRSDNHTSIMVVVDRLTKAAHLIPLAHPYTAKSVAAKFLEFVVKLHGLPKSIVSDRDPIFVCTFWRELWRLSGTQLRLSSAYHPQTDGQTEVVNRIIEQYLCCLSSSNTFAASYITGQSSGAHSFLGPNIGITPPIMPQRECLRSKQLMAANHHHSYITRLVLRQSWNWMNN